MEDISTHGRLEPKNPNILQLYSANTPNGMKVAACLEELVALELTSGAPFEYEPHSVDLKHHEQLKISPAGKIPSIVDPKGLNGQDVHIFESGAILLYLAEKYNELIPNAHEEPVQRMETIKWLFWGSSSLSPACKQFGFYYKYCPHALPYCVERYTKEVKRLLGVLEKQMEQKLYVIGGMYTIADLSMWPWVYALHENYDDAASRVFGDFQEFPNVKAWYQRCLDRPASRKSIDVCPILIN